MPTIPAKYMETKQEAPPTPSREEFSQDNWKHRSKGMRCASCMFYVPKGPQTKPAPPEGFVGRCRRHAPTLGGWPVMFPTDWCGDHRLDENKACQSP